MIFHTLIQVREKILIILAGLMMLGLFILILPENSYSVFSQTTGVILLIYTFYALFKFLGSSRALIHYLRLLRALFVGIIGFAFIVYEGFLVNIAFIVVSVMPIAVGLLECYLAFHTARKARRASWWILLVLGILLIIFGFSGATRPLFDNTTSYMRIVGGTILFFSMVVGLSLIWIWPVRSKEEDKEE